MIEALVLAGWLGAEGGDTSLTALAAASGRPIECEPRSPANGKGGPTLWTVARSPALDPYCDAVALAMARLGSDPAEAKRQALRAEALLPGRASTALLVARAELALGHARDAMASFERAFKVAPRSLEDPATMHDHARALRRTGEIDRSLTLYRELLPRLELVGTNERRVVILIETAEALMASAKDDASRIARASEAAVSLRSALSRPATTLRSLVVALHELAVLRGGGPATGVPTTELVLEPRIEGELDALLGPDANAIRALVLERTGALVAAAAWDRAAEPSSPWADWATKRAALLREKPAETPKKARTRRPR